MRTQPRARLPKVPGFELETLLGKGASGRVFKARRVADGRLVALKQLDPDRLPGLADRARFRREAALLEASPHPCLVPLVGMDLDADPPFLVFVFMPGGDLAARVERGPRLPPAAVAAIGVRIASALGHLHGRAVVHRDVKPGNVLLDAAEQAFLGDLGMGRAAGGQAITASGAAVGTWAYMAPEVQDGERATPASDLFSLAAMLVELFVGELPTRTPQGVIAPRALATSGLPARLMIELRQCLRTAPEDRPEGLAGLGGLLEDVA